ncbi:MAG: LLM class flavin-dependent oxidoreductase [Betaproteobacteria bacterium]|nr:LLM class flavin-dependent oxidoreductase [Betaproteobacteria bacterium]
MDFSTMILSMYVAAIDGPDEDERVIDVAIEQSLLAGQLGFNPWFTEHHFRGPWHSNPMQFAAFLAPQLPPDRYLGFGVLSTSYYHPVRLVESMNLLDQLTKGRTLYGLGSGFPGKEPAGMGVDAEYHGSGRAAVDTLEIVHNLWKFRTGDPDYMFEMPTQRGKISRRVVPAPYRKRHPTIIRTASRDDALVTAAKNGWPAFLGTFGSESPLIDQVHLYRRTLAESNHPPEVVAECMRWCTCDWLSVVVAKSDAEAVARLEEAKAEQLKLRQRFIAEYGSLDGPVVKRKPGESVAAAFAAGGDSYATIAGHPDTVAAKVQELVDLGINHLLARFQGEWASKTRYISEESMRLFSSEIMPRFKDVPPLRDPHALGQR